LASESVQRELGLSDEQQASCLKLLDEQEPNGAAFFRGMMRLSQDEIQAKFERRAKESRAEVAKILTEPQLERLNEINVQKAGVVALGFDDVAKKLGLSAEQRKDLAKLGEESRQKLADLYAGYNGQPLAKEKRQATQLKQKAIHAERENESIAVLSEEQRAKFEKLQGEPFDLSTVKPLSRKYTSRGRIEAPARPR
jgi:hypothetical protein